MIETPSIKDIVEAAGISSSYASMILSDGPNGRTPPRPLAITLYQKLGWRHAAIADLTDAQIAMLAEIDPWTPPKERAAA